MTNLVKWIGRRAATVGVEERSGAPLGLDEWASYFGFNGLQFPIMPTTTYGTNKEEEVAATFIGYVQQAYKANGPIFSCMLARMMLFSEARFQFRQRRGGRPGDLFGNKALAVLEIPWRNGTTGDLLLRAIQDVDIAGNFYAVRTLSGKTRVVRRLRPDWVTIVLGSDKDPEHASIQSDAEVIGYVYHPGGRGSNAKPEVFLPEQVAHWAPIPDPEANYRGMSWITPVVREIMGDSAATTHKLKFFEHGATPNMVVSLHPDVSPENFAKFQELFEETQTGYLNAYRTLYLGGGASVQVVGANMQQLDFKLTQGAGETRIAAAAGVPPVIAGFSEGLQSATYSNYGQARRRFADGTMRPLWRTAASALAPLVDVPRDAELWYDDRDIPFLQEDVKDKAEVQQTQSNSIRTLVEAGFEPDSVVDAVMAEDFSRLKHSGLVSVQMQTIGDAKAGVNKNGSESNGSGNGKALPKAPPKALPKATGNK